MKRLLAAPILCLALAAPAPAATLSERVTQLERASASQRADINTDRHRLGFVERRADSTARSQVISFQRINALQSCLTNLWPLRVEPTGIITYAGKGTVWLWVPGIRPGCWDQLNAKPRHQAAKKPSLTRRVQKLEAGLKATNAQLSSDRRTIIDLRRRLAIQELTTAALDRYTKRLDVDRMTLQLQVDELTKHLAADERAFAKCFADTAPVAFGDDLLLRFALDPASTQFLMAKLPTKGNCFDTVVP